MEDYLSVNREQWNARTELHLNSKFYDVPGFLTGINTLKEIELPLLGDLKGKRVLHLQCHFGLDTLSLARLGARVTGVDLSDRAIQAARDLAARANLDAEFIESDVYALPQRLDKEFDIVFTSYGTIGWLPDLTRWAHVIERALAPDGKFVFAEFHPALWMLDERFTTIQYSYFNDGPILTQEETYTDGGEGQFMNSVSWNHSLAEVFNALWTQGLHIDQFQEYDFTPWNCFPNLKEIGPDRFQFAHLEGKPPMVYALRAVKR